MFIFSYNCGSAREFKDKDGNMFDSQYMTCLWDKSWSPTHILEECVWVACLKPPAPPNSTNLRITDWDKNPIEFGGDAVYVCERGMYFEDDPAQLNVIYQCQEDGFFNVPKEEELWPRCLKGVD